VVCSPSQCAYQHLLPQFDKTPEADQDAIEAARMWLGKESLAQRLIEKARTAVAGWTTESWGNERLRDGGQTSASNESSVVLFGQFDDGNVLLTGDAGVNALTWSANQLEYWGFALQKFKFVQVPHHGSRRNVGPTILNRLIGPILPAGSSSTFSAYVSAPAEDAKHPRPMVTNAFMRRGGRVIATQGQNKIHYGGFAKRGDYVDVNPLPFQEVVEDYD
jgi:beta-lactamase superfamily II metal-dependent hydrolase